MTRREKKKLQSDFLRKAGPNAATFKAAMDALPEIAFYMKDAEGRIMALNRRNCDICNIHDELDAVGSTGATATSATSTTSWTPSGSTAPTSFPCPSRNPTSQTTRSCRKCDAR